MQNFHFYSILAAVEHEVWFKENMQTVKVTVTLTEEVPCTPLFFQIFTISSSSFLTFVYDTVLRIKFVTPYLLI